MYIDKSRRGEKIANPFYSSARWKKVRAEYLSTVHYVCELCGKPAQQVHHREKLLEQDYFVNYEKCYGFANLMALCRECHNRMEGHFLFGKGRQLVADGYQVNMITGELELIPPIPPSEKLRAEAVRKPYEKLAQEK